MVAAVAAGCTAAVYSIGRNLYTNPDVQYVVLLAWRAFCRDIFTIVCVCSLTYDTRGDAVPESDKISKRAEGYSSSFYRGVQSKKENTKIFG